MISGLDSATPPTDAQCQAAVASGVRFWSGYLATKPGVKLLHPWSKADFDRVRAHGLRTIAYVSGWDDPGACRSLAAQWGVPICLDVEGSIRDDGAWVQPWLDASGAGLYGNAPVFPGKRAAFYVLAAYPGSDPKATWRPSVPRPSGLCGWQWQGSHDFSGVGVDATWFDDGFLALQRPVGDDAMLMIQGPTGDVQFVSGGLVLHVDSPTTRDALKAAGVEIAVVTGAFHDAVVAAGKAAQSAPAGAAVTNLKGSITLGPA